MQKVGRIKEQVRPRHDCRRIIARAILYRHAHARRCAVQNSDEAAIDARAIQSGKQEFPETVATDRPEHAGPHPCGLRCNGLIAALPAELGIPAPPDSCLIHAGQVVCLDHDVMVQRADDKNHGRQGHLLSFCVVWKPAQAGRERQRQRVARPIKCGSKGKQGYGF